MNGRVYCATPEQVAARLGPEAMSWARASRPLLVGVYKGECGCILGAIPTSMISDSAYLWLWAPPVTSKVVFARHAIRIVSKLLTMYSSLICNCYNSDSERWLRSLGAEASGPNLFTFWRR